MTITKTSSERLADYISIFGDAAGPVYHSLEGEHFWLRLKWQEFDSLFRSAGRVDILNTAAPAFFEMLQDALSDDILMHIARLTDPPKSYNKQNLTVQALPNLLPRIEPKLADLVDAAVSDAKFAREWRNRRLAHRDLALALGTAAHPLPDATRHSMDKAVESLHAIFAEVSNHYFNAHLDPEVVEAPGGAEVLLHVLRDGVKYRTQQLARFEVGDESADDFEPLPL